MRQANAISKFFTKIKKFQKKNKHLALKVLRKKKFY